MRRRILQTPYQRLNSQGSTHLGLLLVLALIVALFVFVGKGKKNFTEDRPAKKVENNEVKFWDFKKKDGRGVNSLGVEFAPGASGHGRGRTYYPDFNERHEVAKP